MHLIIKKARLISNLKEKKKLYWKLLEVPFCWQTIVDRLC